MTLATLGELRLQDPELATYMVETIGDEAAAWRWFASRSLVLGTSPLRLLLEGKREAVLDALAAIRYGFPV